MAKIYEMPPHLADLIAAGEVVERPGSVVKELIENSIDAGATSVTVEIRNGGMSFIRVMDNGCGMAPEDAEKAFLRHATSKLRDERGLEAIGTLGFRGEALAAISSVSRVTLITKEPSAVEGTIVELEGGEIVTKGPYGCPEGTTMIVRDLFFNTPARLKFMKSDKAEGANVSAVVLRTALSHPEVSVKYIKDGKEELHTPGDGLLESCIYNVLGREFASGLLKAESDVDGVKVSGYVSAPVNCRGNRSWQFFFVNGRYIKSRTLQAALEQAYKNSIFTGRFPVCVLNIELNPAWVDVNVHPAKTEVRFLDERKVFDGVYYSTLNALERETGKAEIKISDSTKDLISNTPDKSGASYAHGGKSGGGDAFRTMSADRFRSSYGAGGFKKIPQPSFEDRQLSFHDDTRVEYRVEYAPPAPKNEPAPRPADDMDFRIIGEAMKLYIIAEKDDTIYLIDKHAAHERIIFDRLKAQERDYPSQLLLAPEVCSINAESAEIILENREVLSEFGFEIEEFGAGRLLLRRVPMDVEPDDPNALLEELAEMLKKGQSELSGMRDEIMHTVACKAAIKAGKSSEPAEVRGLVEKVLSGEVRYCPHGRPVAMEITKAQLDRNFKRT